MADVLALDTSLEKIETTEFDVHHGAADDPSGADEPQDLAAGGSPKDVGDAHPEDSSSAAFPQQSPEALAQDCVQAAIPTTEDVSAPVRSGAEFEIQEMTGDDDGAPDELQDVAGEGSTKDSGDAPPEDPSSALSPQQTQGEDVAPDGSATRGDIPSPVMTHAKQQRKILEEVQNAYLSRRDQFNSIVRIRFLLQVTKAYIERKGAPTNVPDKLLATLQRFHRTTQKVSQTQPGIIASIRKY